MTWIIDRGLLGAQPIASSSTTQKHPLGMIVTASDPTYGSGEFIYLKGNAQARLRDWVTYNLDDGSTTVLAADAIGPVGIAMSTAAAAEFGWFQISGKAIGGCKTAFADNGKVFITASGGRIDDASVTGDLVNNAKGASTTTGGSFVADFEIERPWVDNKSSSTATA